jgi:chromosome segregation protein
MHLKSLDVVGFKSFLEPTFISFSPGITAVVGPNGCGKSNVVDAIRWVLGEQAPTRLRGKSAEDLIYSGNDSNPPAGMAEVSLTLAAEEGTTLPEPYASLSEVAVTRRIYRSGDSEYLINRVSCRLKDITEFFMAAQIHSRGYALVEQGRIDEIIQAKPADIRGMVEEAAGLSLFKGRREMSERKLERVRENLSRVDDVMAEIERQLNYARRQAKKAETYRIVRTELDELEQLTSARRILEQRTDLEQQVSREALLRIDLEELRGRLASMQQVVEEATQSLNAAREATSTRERESQSLRTAIDERSRTRGFLERRLQALDEQLPALSLRLRELDVQGAAVRAARAYSGARLARERRADDDGGERRLLSLREAYHELEQKLKTGERRVEELKDGLAELLREAAVLRGRLGDLSGERVDNEQHRQRLDDERAALSQARVTAQQSADHAFQAYREDQAQLATLTAAHQEEAQREFELRTMIEQSDIRLTALREAREAALLTARRILPEGASERLQSVLQSLNGDGPARPPAMLLDVMKAPPSLEPALRAVLGDQLDAVIVESPWFALRAIEILKESQGGRLSFLSDALAASTPHDAIEAPGIAGRLLELVEVEAGFAGVADALLGHVMLADDLQSAHAAANLNGRGTIFVTREGDLLWPERMISGGSGAHLDNSGEMSMRLRERALERAEASLSDALREHESLLQAAHWAHLALQDLRTAIKTAESAIATKEAKVIETRNALGKIENQISLGSANCAAMERRALEIAQLSAQANARLETLAHEEGTARATLSDAVGELAKNRERVRCLGNEMMELGGRVEARKAELVGAERELRYQRENAERLEQQVGRAREEHSRALVEREELARELDTMLAQEREDVARAEELESLLEGLRLQWRECQSALESARTAFSQIREQTQSVEDQANECRLGAERARTLSEELERGFAERFHTSFDEMSAQLQARLEARDRDADQGRLVELRTRAERIGEVNPAAENEVKELEERASTLGAERADLQAAANDLAHTIQKLNREARKRFSETFEGAARNFEELFPKLLRGGKGRLELAQADDVLEAGVNILVQPAGKKVKEIALLSGGEKALSAMALIFSLFLLNPSPFCVMDEVDAPLDEFSLAAFTSLVSELKQRSQFIIITHNQRTMQAADHIHGVTMETPGISRLISLRIPKAA